MCFRSMHFKELFQILHVYTSFSLSPFSYALTPQQTGIHGHARACVCTQTHTHSFLE